MLTFHFAIKNIVVNITAEGNSICKIGKAFSLDAVSGSYSTSLWPLSTICPIDAFPATSMTNSSGMPIWCSWPFLTCDSRSKSVVAFDRESDGNKYNNRWAAGKTIPTSLGSLTNLQRLSFNRGNLIGTIPASIFSSLKHLTYLGMSYNSLTGSIPSTINVTFVPLQGAMQLDFTSNYLIGNVPSSTFTKLQYMYLTTTKVQWSLLNNCFLISSSPSIRNGLYDQGNCITPHSPGSNH